MIPKSIKDTLTAGMRQVHILIGKGSAIFARTQVEHGNKAKLIINGQYPADHWLSIDGQLHASRSELSFSCPYGRDTVPKFGLGFWCGIQGLLPGTLRPAVIEGTPYRTGHDSQTCTLYS